MLFLGLFSMCPKLNLSLFKNNWLLRYTLIYQNMKRVLLTLFLALWVAVDEFDDFVQEMEGKVKTIANEMEIIFGKRC